MAQRFGKHIPNTWYKCVSSEVSKVMQLPCHNCVLQLTCHNCVLQLTCHNYVLQLCAIIDVSQVCAVIDVSQLCAVTILRLRCRQQSDHALRPPARSLLWARPLERVPGDAYGTNSSTLQVFNLWQLRYKPCECLARSERIVCVLFGRS